MKIFIHSSGRANAPQSTLCALLGGEVEPTLVVQEHEFKKYKEMWGRRCAIIKLPSDITRLSPTRQYLLTKNNGKILLMDDDLTFSIRRIEDPTKFKPATGADVAHMLGTLEAALGTYAHVGVLAREGGNRVTTYWVYATRMMRVLGYDTKRVRKAGARFDRVPTKQDFDMTLQLLRAGLPNAVLAQYVQNQCGSQAKGGCSAYRNEKMNVDSSNRLAEFHPGFVKVVQKTTKTAWGGGTRTDVLVAWKKALKEGEQK